MSQRAMQSPPGGLVGYVLDDDDRTRRARSLLYPIAVILLAVAVLVAYSPIAGAAVTVLGGAAAGLRRWLTRKPAGSSSSA